MHATERSEGWFMNVYSDDVTLVHQFLWRVEELCQDNKLEIVDPGTKEHLWRVLLTIRGLYEIQIPPRVENMWNWNW